MTFEYNIVEEISKTKTFQNYKKTGEPENFNQLTKNIILEMTGKHPDKMLLVTPNQWISYYAPWHSRIREALKDY